MKKPSCGLQEAVRAYVGRESSVGGGAYVNMDQDWRPFQRLNAAAQIAVLRAQRTDVLADRIERMVTSRDEPDQHVHIGAQGAQIVALGHELAAEPIQGYVFGRFGHFSLVLLWYGQKRPPESKKRAPFSATSLNQ